MTGSRFIVLNIRVQNYQLEEYKTLTQHELLIDDFLFLGNLATRK
jgi:hypothetical protein